MSERSTEQIRARLPFRGQDESWQLIRLLGDFDLAEEAMHKPLRLR
jgi:hypothetical protein